MGMSAPKAKTPAQRPERTVDTEEEDIVLGGEEEQPGDLRTQGKRALIKPSGGASTGSTGSGLSV
jgi:hypothetical protein